jgi:hypothetical protein
VTGVGRFNLDIYGYDNRSETDHQRTEHNNSDTKARRELVRKISLHEKRTIALVEALSAEETDLEQLASMTEKRMTGKNFPASLDVQHRTKSRSIWTRLRIKLKLCILYRSIWELKSLKVV